MKLCRCHDKIFLDTPSVNSFSQKMLQGDSNSYISVKVSLNKASQSGLVALMDASC